MQCSKCGHLNRSDARFCARCGGMLSAAQPMPARPVALPVSGATTKLCPHCQAQNPVSRPTCQHCGYHFISAMPTPQHRSRSHWLFWIGGSGFLILGLLLVRTLFGQPTSNVGATPLAVSGHAETLARALAATVQVLVPIDGAANDFSAGSGTVLTENGFILTNFHVIGDSNTQRLYNAQGILLIAVSPPGSSTPPTVLYQAQLVEADYVLDLALIQITARKDGGVLPKSLPLTPIPIGDSQTVHIGDELTLLGFPGIGGGTITLTRGIVAGFLTDWLKTDAEINYGNSGGAAINAAGELVGVPTAGASDESSGTRLPGKLGLVRPINLARHLIERAQANR